MIITQAILLGDSPLLAHCAREVASVTHIAAIVVAHATMTKTRVSAFTVLFSFR